MPSKVYIIKGRTGYKTAKKLKEELNAAFLKHETRLSNRDFIINWGDTGEMQEDYWYERPLVFRRLWLNPSNTVAICSNKISFFHRFRQEDSHESAGIARIPDFTTIKRSAEKWLEENNSVCVRRLVRSHAGRGLSICNPGEPLPDAPLYVKYIKKSDEYRVHIVRDDVFIQKKMRRNSFENPNWKIRNVANGFVFANKQENVGEVPEDVKAQALKAFNKVGLDFGAVDVVYNRAQNKAYVLEINTAPGLTGETLKFYVNCFKKLIAERDNI